MIKKVNFFKVYYFSVILFAFFLPISRAAISFFILFLPTVWLLEGELRKKILSLKDNKVVVTLFLFLLYSSFTFFISTNHDEAINVLKKYGYFLPIVVIMSSFSKRYISKAIDMFLLGMFVSEVIAYGVYFELWSFKNATVLNPSPFMMHIDYSIFLAFTSILLLDRLISKDYSFKEKIFFGFFFLTVTGNLFISIGRTGQVAYFVAVIVLFILHFRVSIKAFLMSMLFLFFTFSLAYQTSMLFHNRVELAKRDINNILKLNLNNSWGIRVAYWIVTANILKKHPFGVGIGDYKDAIKDELKSKDYSFLSKNTINFMQKYHPHNQYLLILLQTGFVGFFLFLSFIYNLIKYKVFDKKYQNIFILFITIYLVGFFAEPLLIKQFTLSLFVFFLGLML